MLCKAVLTLGYVVEGMDVLGVVVGGEGGKVVLEGVVYVLVVEQPYWQVVIVTVEVDGTVEYQVVKLELYVDVTGHVVIVV